MLWEQKYQCKFSHMLTDHLLLYICCIEPKLFILKTFAPSLESLRVEPVSCISIYCSIFHRISVIFFFINTILLRFQKQFSADFLMGECCGSVRRVCVVAFVLKCHFNGVAMQHCWDPWIYSIFSGLLFVGAPTEGYFCLLQRHYYFLLFI